MGSSAETTLQELADGKHETQTALEHAKATIKKTIDMHNEAIQNLTAAISVSKTDEDELEMAEKDAVTTHNNLIASLKADKGELAKHEEAAKGYKKTEEDKLAGLEAKHETDVAALKEALTDTIA